MATLGEAAGPAGAATIPTGRTGLECVMYNIKYGPYQTPPPQPAEDPDGNNDDDDDWEIISSSTYRLYKTPDGVKHLESTFYLKPDEGCGDVKYSIDDDDDELNEDELAFVAKKRERDALEDRFRVELHRLAKEAHVYTEWARTHTGRCRNEARCAKAVTAYRDFKGGKCAESDRLFRAVCAKHRLQMMADDATKRHREHAKETREALKDADAAIDAFIKEITPRQIAKGKRLWFPRTVGEFFRLKDHTGVQSEPAEPRTPKRDSFEI